MAVGSMVDLRVVAHYRGTACFSDKTVDKVIGYSVRFTDGSWANLLSRRHAGGAPGRVFFLRAPADVEAVAGERRSEHLGRVVRLALAGSGADVLVVAAPEGEGRVELFGNAGFLAGAAVEERARTVRVSWHRPDPPTEDGEARPVVRCSVSSGAQLTVEAEGGGHFWIAAPTRELDAAMDGHASMVCEQTEGLDAALNGAGQMFVARAHGRARVRVNASGSAVVAGGELEELDAGVRSTGSIVVHADVEEAILSNTGSGSLVVPSIRRRSGEQHAGPGPLLAGRPAEY
jgi:hypothetical protein